MIAESNNRIYYAYRLKEVLRPLLKIRGVREAKAEQDLWLWWVG